MNREYEASRIIYLSPHIRILFLFQSTLRMKMMNLKNVHSSRKILPIFHYDSYSSLTSSLFSFLPHSLVIFLFSLLFALLQGHLFSHLFLYIKLTTSHFSLPFFCFSSTKSLVFTTLSLTNVTRACKHTIFRVSRLVIAFSRTSVSALLNKNPFFVDFLSQIIEEIVFRRNICDSRVNALNTFS